MSKPETREEQSPSPTFSSSGGSSSISIESLANTASMIEHLTKQLGCRIEDVVFIFDYDNTLRIEASSDGKGSSVFINGGIEFVASLQRSGAKVGIVTHNTMPAKAIKEINERLQQCGVDNQDGKIPIITSVDLAREERTIQSHGKHASSRMSEILLEKLGFRGEQPRHIIITGDHPDDINHAVLIKQSFPQTEVTAILLQSEYLDQYIQKTKDGHELCPLLSKIFGDICKCYDGAYDQNQTIRAYEGNHSKDLQGILEGSRRNAQTSGINLLSAINYQEVINMLKAVSVSPRTEFHATSGSPNGQEEKMSRV